MKLGSLRHKWMMSSKPPPLSRILSDDEQLVWSHFRDDEMMLSIFEPRRLVISYSEIFGQLICASLGAYGIWWRFSELLSSGFSLKVMAWLGLFLGFFVWAGYSAFDNIKDIHFPNLKFKKDERLFLITNRRLLSTDGVGRIIQEMSITEISGFADLAYEKNAEADEDDEEGYERELLVSQKGKPSPFSGGFYFHHIPDKEKVMNIISELANVEIKYG